MNEPAPADYIIREACQADIPQLEEFVNRFVQANRLLPRTTDELCDLIPFGFVAVSEGHIVGFAGAGNLLCEAGRSSQPGRGPEFSGTWHRPRPRTALVDLAVKRNVLEVMAITSSDRFFQACGFDFTLPGEKKALFIQTREHF
ncbi:MAG UNVERIFIED_CONTAM: N-acetylglutamate synthase [Planctomycetaceae bacterium]|jgi:N-acetylglutamate synthase-like GNAT family acetyltransferase